MCLGWGDWSIFVSALRLARHAAKASGVKVRTVVSVSNVPQAACLAHESSVPDVWISLRVSDLPCCSYQ